MSMVEATAPDGKSPALPTGSRVLVTGATGFIGSHLLRRLVTDGAEVHALTSTVSSVGVAAEADCARTVAGENRAGACCIFCVCGVIVVGCDEFYEYFFCL